MVDAGAVGRGQTQVREACELTGWVVPGDRGDDILGVPTPRPYPHIKGRIQAIDASTSAEVSRFGIRMSKAMTNNRRRFPPPRPAYHSLSARTSIAPLMAPCRSPHRGSTVTRPSRRIGADDSGGSPSARPRSGPKMPSSELRPILLAALLALPSLAAAAPSLLCDTSRSSTRS